MREKNYGRADGRPQGNTQLQAHSFKEHDDCAKFYFQRMMALQVAQELQAQVTRLDYMLELVNQEDFWRDLSSAVIMGGDLNIVRRRRKLSSFLALSSISSFILPSSLFPVAKLESPVIVTLTLVASARQRLATALLSASISVLELPPPEHTNAKISVSTCPIWFVLFTNSLSPAFY
ncbi:hypothetical protein PS2_019088 [Malus domestica]